MNTQQSEYQKKINQFKPLSIDNEIIGQLGDNQIIAIKIDLKGIIVSINNSEMYLNSVINHSPYISLDETKVKDLNQKYKDYVKSITI